jgi:3'-phosphoadenosine 5'-phosphosulfate sulfotransferase (PAPS reductase)/FAD synthetase
VAAAVQKCNGGTAPGEDGVPYEAFKVLFTSRGEAHPEVVDVVDGLATMYTAVLREHEVPGRWKQGQVSMLYKGKGASDLCTNYRGLTMLNVAGKIWERVALPRLERVASAHGAIHENQN